MTRPFHKFEPIDDLNIECKLCGLDAYWGLDPVTKQYPPCTYSKLVEIPKVSRKNEIPNLQ